MTCRIPYLDNNYQGKDLSFLRQVHSDLGKEIRSATDTDGDLLFFLKAGYLVLNPDGHDRRIEQQTFLDKLNNRLRQDYDSPDQADLVTIRPVTLPNGTSPKDVVTLDVRPLLPDHATGGDLGIDELAAFTDQIEAGTQQELVSGFGAFAQSAPNHPQFFRDLLLKSRKLIDQYIASIERGQVNLPTNQMRLKNLRYLASQLRDGPISEVIENLSNYVVSASNIIDSLHLQFFEEDENVRLTFTELQSGHNLQTAEPLTPAEQAEKVQWIARQINKSKHFLYLFEGLRDMKFQLTDMGYLPSSDQSLNRGPEFTDAFNDFLGNSQWQLSQSSLGQIQGFLQSPEFSVAGLHHLTAELMAGDNPDLPAGVYQLALNELRSLLDAHRSDTVDSVLDQSINKAEQLKSSLRRYHRDLISEWLWPKIEEKQKGYTGIHKLDKEKFNTLLEMGDKDEPVLKAWLDAVIKSNDPLTAIVGDTLSDALYRAYGPTRQDVTDLQGYWEESGIGKGKTEEQVRSFYDGMTHEVDRVNLNTLEEVDEDWVDDDGLPKPFLEISTLGITKRFKAYKKKSLLGRYNTAKAEATRHIFEEQLPKEVKKLFDLLQFDQQGNVLDSEFYQFLTDNMTNPYYASLRERFYFWPRNGGPGRLKNWVHTPGKEYIVRNNIKKSLRQQFFRDNFQLASPEEQTDLMKRLDILDGEGRTKTIARLPKEFWNHASSSRKDPDRDVEAYRQTLTKPENADWLNGLVSQKMDGKTWVLIKKTLADQTGYVWVDVNQAGSFEGMVQFFYKSGDFQQPEHSQYHIESGGFGLRSQQQWSSLKSDTPKWDYYQKLRSTYRQANQQAGRAHLKHYQLPQIQQQLNVQVGEAGFFGRLWDYLKTTLVGEVVRDIHRAVTGQAGQEEERTTTYQEQYLNGQPVKTIPLRFTQDISDSQVERDLLRSILAYKASANQYAALREIEPQVQVLRSMLDDDDIIGIKARGVKQTDAKGRYIQGKMGNFLREKEPLLNKKLREFIDDVVYGDSEYGQVINALGFQLDLGKVSNRLMQYTSFSNLAWNISSMAGNLGIGHLNNLALSIGQKYYTKQQFGEAEKEYWLNSPKSVRDLTIADITKKSNISQLLLRFDGIQGELMDEFGEVSSTGNTNKILGRAMYWTMGGAEHSIQTVSMIAQLKGFKLPSGKSLWEAVKHQEGQEIGFDPEVTPELMDKFRKQLHKVNKDLHGQYAKLDKAMLQRRWFGKLAMMFKKYIYSSFRYRFADNHFDWESGEEEEGYILSYLTQLYAEAKQFKGAAFYGAFATNFLLKPTLGAVDQLAFGAFSRNSDKARQFLYGETGDLRAGAARQTAFDLMWLNVFFFVGVGLHAANEDDDDSFLKNIELFARRMEGDIGMYMPFYVGFSGIETFTTYDKMMQMVKNPFAQMRAYDASINLLGQLVGVEYSDDGVNLTFNDQYTKNGNSYRKGDYKIERMAYKSVIGPWWQVIRLMNPDEQLQYLNMVRKNSK